VQKEHEQRYPKSSTLKPVKSRLVEGKILPPTSLELIVSDHCNIACRQCNHASPVIRKWNIDPDEVRTDLSTLAKVYRPAKLKLIGGEPLLHPRLEDVILAARASNISDYLHLVTNGLLLNRMTDGAWRALDEIEISGYPNSGVGDKIIAEARKKGWKFNTKVTLTVFSDFRYTFSKYPIEDTDLVRKIFAGCKIANHWGCHAIYKGHIYRCPQSIYAPTLAGKEFSDGLKLETSPDFQETLLNFLNEDAPLQSCSNCVGTNGKKIRHELLKRKAWADDLETPPEEMIDYELLEKSLIEYADIDDCRNVTKPRRFSMIYFRNKIQNLRRATR